MALRQLTPAAAARSLPFSWARVRRQTPIESDCALRALARIQTSKPSVWAGRRITACSRRVDFLRREAATLPENAEVPVELAAERSGPGTFVYRVSAPYAPPQQLTD